MKKILCMLLTAMLLLPCLPAAAETMELTQLSDWSAYFAFGLGDDLAVICWCPLPEGVDADSCFATVISGDADNVLMSFDVLPSGSGEVVTKEDIFREVENTVGWTEADMLADGYVFDAEQYLFFGPAAFYPIEEAENLAWINIQIYTSPFPLTEVGPFRPSVYNFTTGADSTFTLNGLMENTGDEACCVDEVKAVLLLDGRRRLALCPVVEAKTPPVGIPAGETTPVTITAQMPAGFAPIEILPVCSVTTEGFDTSVQLDDLDSELVIGKSGDYCNRYSLPYTEGTDPADYYIVCRAFDTEWRMLACQWFMPGEGVLEEGRVVFPIVPAYLGHDAMLSAQSGYLIRPAAEE